MSDVAATRSWLRYVAGGAVVAFAYLLLPRFAVLPDWLPRLLLYGAVSASAVACLVLGVRRYRPEQLLPWYLLLAGQVLYLLADLTFYTLHLVVGSQAYPSVADVLYLAHYPFVVAGVLALVRSRTPGSDRVSLNDAAIIATSLGVLSWVFLVAPAVLAHGVPVQMRMVSVAYPIMDLLVLAVAARLVVGVGFRPPAYWLFVLSLLVLLATDTAYTALQLNGLYQLDSLGGRLLDAGRLASYLLLGAAALHPSMRSLTERDHRATPRSGWGRLTFLAGVSMLPLALIVVQELRGQGRDTWIVGIACMGLFLLVVLRMFGLVRMVESNAAQLREQGAELEAALLLLEADDGREARELVAGVRKELYGEITGLRRLMAALRPPVLDERGLTLALRDLLEAFERRTGIDCALQGESRIRVEPEIETVLYRVVQEALTNVAKHAHAGHVWVYLRVDDDRVDMQVHDDGIGFDATRVNGLVGSGHFGLAGMRERVEIAGGTHRLLSAPGDGTTIRVRLPRRRVPA